MLIYIEGISECLSEVVKSIEPNFSAGIEHYTKDNKYQIIIFGEDGNKCACTESYYKHELMNIIKSLPESWNNLLDEFNRLSALL